MIGVRVWRRFRRSPRLAPLRRHLPAALALTAWTARRRHPAAASALAAVALGGWGRTYLADRRRHAALMEEQRARMARLRPEVLAAFYRHCISSMEEELASFPRYDRRKHEQRYRLVADLATRFVEPGAVVVDVGCASGVVLDLLAASCPIRAVGFDLAAYGLLQRRSRPRPPLLAQAVVEAIPLGDEVADLVLFSEVIEHLVDAAAGMREVSRITKLGGHVLLTTNNAAEMPDRSPVVDPLLWFERWLAVRWPKVLSFRNLTWPEPIHPSVDPLPREAPTYAPHIHYSPVELRRLADRCGMETVLEGSFEYPVPQSRLAEWLRCLSAFAPDLGDRCSDFVDRALGTLPGVHRLGTHTLLVLRKTRPTPASVPDGWWPGSVASLAPLVAAERDGWR